MVWYVVALGVFALLMAVCILRATRSDKVIAKDVLNVLGFDLLIIVANLICMLTSSSTVAVAANIVYFISVDFLVCYLARFSMKYCNFNFGGKWYLNSILAIAVLDSVSILLDPVFNHVFDVEYVNLELWGGVSHWMINAYFFYNLHFAISMFLFIQSLVILLHKIMISSKFANEKYITLSAFLLITGLFEGLHLAYPEIPNISMIFYAVTGFLVFSYSTQYIPSALLEKMKSTIVSTVNEAIVFFDEEGRCIYANSNAKFLFDIKSTAHAEGSREYKEVYDKFYELIDETEESIKNVNNKHREARITENDELMVYDAEYHTLHDGAGKLMGAFARFNDVTESFLRNEKFRLAATHDKLTGIYNREGFFDKICQRLIDDPDTTYLAIGSDVKEFKLVNDRYGKEAGDAILKRIAKTIQDKATKYTLYGRLGGDRFGVFIRKEDYEEEVFIKALAEIPTVEIDTQFPIIIHMGVYQVDDVNTPVPVMFDRAFMALDEIKSDVDNRVAYYDGSIRDELLWEQKITGNLEKAIREGHIVPYLQAQVQADGSLTGAEVLVRWKHPEDGFLSPARFISILEKNGMIGKLDRYMWECACRILRKWKVDGRGDLYLSVNISPKDFYLMDVVGTLKELTSIYSVDPASLRLEITESMMMDDVQQKIKTIQELRDYGFIVEMDDFGSGYSSLNMLKDMPVDILKLDMGFLSKSSEDEKLKKIVDVIITLAHDLGLGVVAEGVETSDQVDFLSEKKCEVFQGYYYARPVGLEEFKIS